MLKRNRAHRHVMPPLTVALALAAGLVALLGLPGCGEEPTSSQTGAVAGPLTGSATDGGPAPARPSPAKTSKQRPSRLGETEAPSQPMPGARRAFEEVMRLIESQYVEADLAQDAVWTGAVEGVLGRLIQTPGIKVNTLMDPFQLKEMKLGLKGSFSGVGIVIKTLGDVVVITGLLKDGPAEQAGVQAGDRILAIDGQRVRGMTLEQIVSRIRGPAGTPVKLFLQRDVKEWTQPIVRGTVKLQAVNGGKLDGEVAYLHITSFQSSTVQQLDDLITSLLTGGARAVVLDLRQCPGGLLEVAVEVADRFLPPGRRVVSLRRRDGKEEVHMSRGHHPADTLPVVVLMDRTTSSGAEIVAAALSEAGRATLVGQPTLGKGTVEEILKLSNGWALKLTVARFYTAGGRSLQGQGVTPDFHISAPPPTEPTGLAAPLPTAQSDPLVGAALNVLRLTLPRR